MTITFTILGQAYSKANSRRLVKFGNRMASVKSKEALAYERDAQLQIPAHARAMLEGPVFVKLRMFYATERPDLDESLLLDVLQAKFEGTGSARQLIRRGVYLNDRQVRKKLVEHFIDRTNPRVEIEIEPMHPQQPTLAIAPIPEKPKTRHVKRRLDIPIYGDVGIGVGVDLPMSAQGEMQAGQPWAITDGQGSVKGSWGGHYIYLCGYNATGPVCVTWGRKQQLTWAWFEKYCDEAYAMFDAKNTFARSKFVDGPAMRAFLDTLAH